MPLYTFLAKDPNGKKFTGEVESVDERSLASTLQKEGLVPIDIKERATSKSLVSSLPVINASVSSAEISGFTRQLSTMISAGLPLADSLVILEKQAKNKTFARMLTEILADVEGGMALSSALSKHPKAFDMVFVKLIEAGETGGVLDKILIKLAENLEKEREFRSKTRGAFIYPAIVGTVMILVVAIMMIFVIPKLTALYTEIGADLPLPTKILITTSNFTRSFWWLIIVVLVAFVFGFRMFAKTPHGDQVLSKVTLGLPIWGKIRKALILAQFTRTLGLLIGAGIPILSALKVVSQILASQTFKEGIEVAISRVERGSPLYQPLSTNSAFPPIIGQMVRVGEETGKMDEVLNRLAIYFEGEGEAAVRNLSVALEPIILVVLGIGVGILVLSIILPIYNLTAQF